MIKYLGNHYINNYMRKKGIVQIMNYDIQLRSELFSLNSFSRIHQFQSLFESTLNPMKGIVESYNYNKHKNIFARMIDWFKRVITIHIPAFFKNLFKLTPKVSPMALQILSEITQSYENELKRLGTKIKVCVNKTDSDTTMGFMFGTKDEDYFTASTIKNTKNLDEETHFYIKKINDEFPSLSESSFKRLDSNYEKRLKLALTAIKNLFENIKDKDVKNSVTELFNDINKYYGKVITNFLMISKAGSIQSWKKDSSSNNKSENKGNVNSAIESTVQEAIQKLTKKVDEYVDKNYGKTKTGEFAKTEYLYEFLINTGELAEPHIHNIFHDTVFMSFAKGDINREIASNHEDNDVLTLKDLQRDLSLWLSLHFKKEHYQTIVSDRDYKIPKKLPFNKVTTKEYFKKMITEVTIKHLETTFKEMASEIKNECDKYLKKHIEEELKMWGKKKKGD